MKNRRRNPGWFKAGKDARRRRGFTKAECQRGYLAAREKIQDQYGIDAYFWFLNRVRESYTHKTKRSKRQ